MAAMTQAALRRAAPSSTTAAKSNAGGARLAASGGLVDARVSSILSGKRLYRMGDGRIIELPDDMTAEDAAKLERDAKAAQARLGKGPPPKPVPEVRKEADKKEKKDAKAENRGKSGDRGKPHTPRTSTHVAKLQVPGGKAAQYLVGKAAPVLAKGTSVLRKLSQHEQTHDDSTQKLAQSEKAVVNPDSENQSRSNSGQVTAVGSRPAPPVDESKGKQKLQDSLKENVPQSIEDVDNFKRDMKGQHIGADVLDVVQGDKNAVVTTFTDMERTPPPAPPEQTPVPLPPQEVAPGTSAMNLGQGAISPLLPEHTDVSKYTNDADAKLKEEGVTQEQLDMVDSGDLASANKEKKGMQQMAKSQPAAVQTFAKQQTAKVDGDMKNEEKKQRGAMTSKRKHGLGATGEKQKGAKSALEKKRDEVAAKINGIYKAAQDKVKTRLADLEKQSMKRFDDGNAKATKDFEDDVNRDIDAYKDDRYSGVFGWARKAKDWLLGMDELPGVKTIFDRNRAAFVSRIDRLVADISADNKRVIQECKDQLARAKTDIKDYVDKLGPSLKDIGKKAAGEVNRQLEDMDKFIRNKEEDLQQSLADKQKAAIKSIDEKIEKMKDDMGGALAKLGKLLLWAAKKLFTWALSQFGYSLGEIEGIISRGVAVLKAIFTKPIVFVKNLMKAAIQGFKQFSKNFLKHLKDAVFEWLTGSLEGVQLPSTWDLKGILSVALQMIGISYQNIRVHMVTVMGEPMVVGLEKGFALVKTLITEGPMAAWEQLKEMASDMGDAFVDAAKDFIKTKIVEQAIITLGTIFIPGAGLIKAVIGIYDTIVFFIKKARDIIKMVGNFLSSIGDIVAGNISGAADAMEDGLARGLYLVISFLAQLTHLDGITAKLRNAIQKIRGKVDDVLLKVAKWIADKASKLFGAIKTGAMKLVEWWKTKISIDADGKKLTLLTEGTEEDPKVLVAASPAKPWSDYVKTLPAAAKSTPAYAKALALAQKLEAKKKPIRETDEKKRKAATDAAAKEMQKDANALASLIAQMNGKSKSPTTVAKYGQVDGVGSGTWAESTILTGDHPPGSEPRDYAPIWENLADLGAAQNKKVRKDWYVQGHLLNHNLGGPGMRFNLTPITKKANNDHKGRVETDIKKEIAGTKGMVMYYYVEPQKAWGASLTFPRLTMLEGIKPAVRKPKEEAELASIKALRKLTRGFECRAYELEQNASGKWVKKKGGFKVPKTIIPNDLNGGGDPYGY